MQNEADILVDVRRALQEDVGTGDVTAALLPEHLAVTAIILAREPLVVCGIPWVQCVFSETNPNIRIHWDVSEGQWCEKPQTLCRIEGLARDILTAERTALNFLQTLSATATETHRYVQRLKGYHTRVLDTRKTIPGLRLAQKYAVICGGGLNHRMGLYDAFLIKENHIRAYGSVRKAIAAARASRNDLFLEVEVETLAELHEALEERPSRILLDNFTVEMIAEAVTMNKPKRTELEVSGGVQLDTVTRIAATGVDFVSIGALTKSIKAIDLSLLIEDKL